MGIRGYGDTGVRGYGDMGIWGYCKSPVAYIADRLLPIAYCLSTTAYCLLPILKKTPPFLATFFAGAGVGFGFGAASGGFCICSRQ